MGQLSRFRRRGTGKELPAAELVRECGRKLTDRALWQQFHERFQKPIFTFLLRALKRAGAQEDMVELVHDLAQEAYARLARNDGHMLRSFRGTTEFSAMAFLARICMSVATDHQRSVQAGKRGHTEVISIEEIREADGPVSALDLNALLAWIDVERLVESDTDRRNATRNVLVFKLHYVDGLTAEEIAQFAGFNLTRRGVESVLGQLRERIRGGMEHQ